MFESRCSEFSMNRKLHSRVRLKRPAYIQRNTFLIVQTTVFAAVRPSLFAAPTRPSHPTDTSNQPVQPTRPSKPTYTADLVVHIILIIYYKLKKNRTGLVRPDRWRYVFIRIAININIFLNQQIKIHMK
ncbi:hypothetical protein BpHYR1_039662 [Brachionus plicatilis]|uniref:Uncharacterized protein n=1 Tax=Brachionus plicatilis TaxID=10195 RepID=A0A3M7R1F0_BRAPC|nr:hypothetical protein BpHYR1_039662 [Brachionus plicatilis]